MKHQYESIEQQNELKKLDDQLKKFDGKVTLMKTKVNPETGKKTRIIKITKPNKKNNNKFINEEDNLNRR